MKKTIMVIALVSIIGLTGMYQASAYMGVKDGKGCSGQAQGMPGGTEMDAATKAKFEVFFKDTQELRKAIFVKRAQKKAIMHAEEPDIEKVGKIAGDLFDLRNSMRTKAEEAGLGDYVGMRGGCHQKCGSKSPHGRKGMMKEHMMMDN